jgi:hypothetical protein
MHTKRPIGDLRHAQMDCDTGQSQRFLARPCQQPHQDVEHAIEGNHCSGVQILRKGQRSATPVVERASAQATGLGFERNLAPAVVFEACRGGKA